MPVQSLTMIDAVGIGPTIAAALQEMVMERDAEHERSLQTAIGPSEIGDPCTRCLARKVLGIPESPSDPWCRIIGTAGHGWLDEAAAKWNVRHDRARYWPEKRVYPHDDALPVGGSADLYDADLKCVIDHKIVGPSTMKRVRAKGSSETYNAQRHLYGLGYSNAGVPVEHVAIAYWPRSGTLSQLHVDVVPYDPAVARAAIDRYQTIKATVTAIGPLILDQLSSDPDCYECARTKPWAPATGWAPNQQAADLWSHIVNEPTTQGETK